jgi:hypothetical protein
MKASALPIYIGILETGGKRLSSRWTLCQNVVDYRRGKCSPRLGEAAFVY